MVKKFIIRQITVVVAVIAAIAAAGGAVWWFLLREKEPPIVTFRASAGEAATMARLCSVEIYNEATLLDTINSKMLFAIQKQRGRISFDIDSLQVASRGDTLIVNLPPERVDLYEDTGENSWVVVDSKNIAPLGFMLPDRLSLAEENALKRKFRARSIDKLYATGVVRRARNEASENLRLFLQTLWSRPVEVIDPGELPPGARHGKSLPAE